MSTAAVKEKVMDNIGVVLGMIAILVMAGMTAAASISTQLKAGVVTAAGFIEIYLLLWIVKQF